VGARFLSQKKVGCECVARGGVVSRLVSSYVYRARVFASDSGGAVELVLPINVCIRAGRVSGGRVKYEYRARVSSFFLRGGSWFQP
jgi:hypothetical protein